MSAEGERKTEAIPEWKREEVDELVDFIERYDSIGIVDVTGIASRQLQEMRAGLHGTAELRMSRNTLLERALAEIDDGLEALVDHLGGHVGLIGTSDNPFGLFQELEASKTSAPIGAGEVAPNDIVIPAGDTGMDPGPFVGELQNVGAAAQIMEGSIQVTEESVVAEQGETVSEELANVLAEMGIEPKEVGLDLRVVYSDGVLFDADDLDIDVEGYRDDLQAGAAGARNLSINAGYPTARTAPAILATAGGEATALGLAAAIESPDLIDDLLARGDADLRALAAEIDDEEALPEELRGVEAPEPAAPTEEDTETEDDTEDAEEEPEAADDEAEEDDDEDAGAEGLGDMFG